MKGTKAKDEEVVSSRYVMYMKLSLISTVIYYILTTDSLIQSCV